jgi:indole-3-glycerol phosphate synthase
LKNLNQNSTDYLEALAAAAVKSVMEGYYDVEDRVHHKPIDLRKAIIGSRKVPIITEIKYASPSKGVIRHDGSPVAIALSMERAGAVAISFLTEPKYFKGSIRNFIEVRKASSLPMLMKDIILYKKQLDTAVLIGADAVLLILDLYKRGYGEVGINEMIREAHKHDLQVLLETHSEEEFHHALATDSDLIGINNRNLVTMKTDLQTTEALMSTLRKKDKVIVSESGIETHEDILRLKKTGVDAFLVGSSIMSFDNVETKVSELVNAYD